MDAVSDDWSPIDTSMPNGARTYDVLLGGTSGFGGDRALAARLEGLYPRLPAVLATSRAFGQRAITWCARQGISQFADLGAGMPVSSPRTIGGVLVEAVHATARAVNPSARVAYVDTDDLAVAHTRGLYARDTGIAAARSDIRDPAAVLADPELRKVIDPSAPVCVLLTMVLHYLDAATARAVAAGYAQRIAPGSVVAVSVLRCEDAELLERARQVYTLSRLHNHTRDDVESFLSGLDIVTPGVVTARGWRAGMPDPGLRPREPVHVLAGAARTL